MFENSSSKTRLRKQTFPGGGVGYPKVILDPVQGTPGSLKPVFRKRLPVGHGTKKNYRHVTTWMMQATTYKESEQKPQDFWQYLLAERQL